MEFKSEMLKRTVPVNLILPFERFKGTYPALYLLHGLTDNCNGWLSYSRIHMWAEDSGLAVVMPSGENSFYTSAKDIVFFLSYGHMIPQALSQKHPACLCKMIKDHKYRANSF